MRVLTAMTNWFRPSAKYDGVRPFHVFMLRQEVRDYYRNFRVTPDLIELRNLLEVADLIVRSALSRHESRGLHYTLDYPDMLKEAKDTVLVP